AERRILRLSCAGHPPPLFVRHGQDVLPMRVDSVPALLLAELGNVPCAELQLQSGDRMLLYTDGITDRQAADETMFDGDRLMSALDQARSLDLPAVVQSLVADLDAFAGSHEPHDDQTLLLIGIT
ncbi:MAG: PP2C family protein-serine/threonine phosphatase, partial [Vicinamibacterales bacterium]